MSIKIVCSSDITLVPCPKTISLAINSLDRDAFPSFILIRLFLSLCLQCFNEIRLRRAINSGLRHLLKAPHLCYYLERRVIP